MQTGDSQQISTHAHQKMSRHEYFRDRRCRTCSVTSHLPGSSHVNTASEHTRRRETPSLVRRRHPSGDCRRRSQGHSSALVLRRVRRGHGGRRHGGLVGPAGCQRAGQEPPRGCLVHLACESAGKRAEVTIIMLHFRAVPPYRARIRSQCSVDRSARDEMTPKPENEHAPHTAQREIGQVASRKWTLHLKSDESCKRGQTGRGGVGPPLSSA